VYIIRRDESPGDWKGSFEAELKWTTDPPTEEGWYWVYTVPEWETVPVVACVKVCIMNDVVSFDIPAGGYESEDYIHAHATTHWLGPLPPPEPPQ
jgi:hypothetical protein